MRRVAAAGAVVVAALLAPVGPAGSAVAAAARAVQEVGRVPIQEVGRVPVQARRVTGEIDVDGRVDEATWAEAEPIPLPWEVHPGDNQPAPAATECRVVYDDEALYLGCRATEPDPGTIRAFYTDRDATDGQDRIFLVLDPFADARRGFEFGVTALGVQEDLVWDQTTGTADRSWDAIWASAGRITPSGYGVEARIPFRSLRFPSEPGATWGFYLKRERPRSDLVVTRSAPLDPNDGCTLCQAGGLAGIRGVAPGLNLELGPTLTTSRVDRRVGTDATVTAGDTDRSGSPGDSGTPGESGSPADLRAGPVELEPGLDVRWSPTSDVTLNATVNPDFSQVEADAPQLEANQRFALRFPEKRPFFLEGAELFSTPVEAVFTRAVTDPSGGAKATGKVGGHAFGAVAVRDEVTGILLPGPQGSSSVVLERPSTTAALRYRRDVGESGTVGALYTGRVGDGYHNHVAGADLSLRPLPAVSVRAQLLHSVTADPAAVAEARAAGAAGAQSAGAGAPGAATTGQAARLRVGYLTREWDVGTALFGFTPGFRADAGFVPRVDVRNVGVWAGRTFWGEEGAPFTSLELRGGAWHTGRWAGGLLGEGVWANVVYGGPWQSQAYLNPEYYRERLEGRTFGLAKLWAGFSVRPTGALGLAVHGVVGDAVDVANVREATELQVSPSAALRLGRHLELRGALHWQRLTRDGERVLRALASEVRGVYSLGTRAFLRATLQLQDTDRNPALHVAAVHPSRTTLRSELLFSYKLDPVSVLFLGYGDRRAGSVGPDLEETPLRPAERSFFLKLGYGWRP